MLRRHPSSRLFVVSESGATGTRFQEFGSTDCGHGGSERAAVLRSGGARFSGEVAGASVSGVERGALADNCSGDASWSPALAGAGGAATLRWALSDVEQSVARTQGDAVACSGDRKAGLGSGPRAQLSTGGPRTLALAAEPGEWVVSLEVCAVSRRQVVRATTTANQIPRRLRRSVGRQIAPVRSGSGVLEKNIEVQIARRFKRQGRSWTRRGAEYLLQLCWLQTNQGNWTHWWQKTALAKTKVTQVGLHPLVT